MHSFLLSPLCWVCCAHTQCAAPPTHPTPHTHARRLWRVVRIMHSVADAMELAHEEELQHLKTRVEGLEEVRKGRGVQGWCGSRGTAARCGRGGDAHARWGVWVRV